MPRLIDRYVLREIVPPFLVGLLLVAFVLLMNEVLLLAELFIAKGVPALEALRILGLLVPSVLAFALPMAVLMGVLGGLARLSADSEIVALRSLGVGQVRLARPIALFGLAGFLVTLPLALYVAPRANGAWVRAMTDSVVARVRLDVDPLEFNETLPGTVFLVRGVESDGRWRDVFAYLGKDRDHPRLVMARSGTVRLFPNERRAVLELENGTVHSWPTAAPDEDTVTSFERLEEEVDVAGLFASVSSEKRVREKDVGELLRDLRRLEAEPAPVRQPRQVRAHRIEIHKKFALAAACLVFALLGLPLGVMTGRAGRTGGFSLGLAVILLYYALLTAGESAAMDGRVPAFLAMWGPDILLAAAGALLLVGASRGYVVFRLFRARPMPAPEASATASPPAAPNPSRRSPFPRSSPYRYPGLIDRYISGKFLALLGLVLAALTAAAFLVSFFERLGDALERGKPAGLVFRYAAARLPELLAFLLPAAVLTAALLALGFLTRTNEATALKACGVSAYRTALPVLVLAAAVGGLAFLVQERIVPAAHARSEAARSSILDLAPRSYSYLNRHWVLGRSGDRVFHYDYFEPGSATFSRLSVYDLDAGRWTLFKVSFAATATFEGNALRASDGWTRAFDPAAGPRFFRAPDRRLDIAGEKSAFLEPWKEPQQMTCGELRRYAAEIRGLGFPASRLRTALALRTALPFASLVMALLAVPFGFRMGRKGTLVALGLGVALAIVYWGVFALCRGLGVAGILGPFLGAWGANLLFGLGGVVGMMRTRT
jgi:LPS export ABC transporter permease LptF/LPS export ABC transporter permease LptG